MGPPDGRNHYNRNDDRQKGTPGSTQARGSWADNESPTGKRQMESQQPGRTPVPSTPRSTKLRPPNLKFALLSKPPRTMDRPSGNRSQGRDGHRIPACTRLAKTVATPGNSTFRTCLVGDHSTQPWAAIIRRTISVDETGVTVPRRSSMPIWARCKSRSHLQSVGQSSPSSWSSITSWPLPVVRRAYWEQITTSTSGLWVTRSGWDTTTAGCSLNSLSAGNRRYPTAIRRAGKKTWLAPMAASKCLLPGIGSRNARRACWLVNGERGW